MSDDARREVEGWLLEQEYFPDIIERSPVDLVALYRFAQVKALERITERCNSAARSIREQPLGTSMESGVDEAMIAAYTHVSFWCSEELGR